MAGAGAGYSGTPLAKKLGIKEGARVLVTGAPSDFSLDDWPVGAKVAKSGKGPFDVALVFVREARALERAFATAAAALTPEGGLWIAWPKKSSGVATDVTEDVLRDVLLVTGFVDNKVCAIDATWSGLRFVLRRENRPNVKTAKKRPRA